MAFTRTAVIAASPERIFSVLSDLEHSKEWMPAIQRIDGVTPGPFRSGAGRRGRRHAKPGGG